MKLRTVFWGFAATAAGLVWAGLRTPVRPLPLRSREEATSRVPVPSGLPAPVARYFAVTAGDSVPLAVAPRVTGTARMRVPGLPFPLWMNARWTGEYQPGKAFTRVMELGFFGETVLTAVDEYRDGVGSVTVMGQRDSGPNVDQAADLVLWAESVWMPSVLFATPGLEWVPVDDTRARLRVPYKSGHHEVTWHFDPQTGLLTHQTSFRFKGTESRWKTAWRVDVREYATFQGIRIPSRIDITWEDDGKPWATFAISDITFGGADETITPAAHTASTSIES